MEAVTSPDVFVLQQALYNARKLADEHQVPELRDAARKVEAEARESNSALYSKMKAQQHPEGQRRTRNRRGRPTMTKVCNRVCVKPTRMTLQPSPRPALVQTKLHRTS